MVDSLFKKRSTKYDIFFYDNIYTKKFSSYFVDLNNYIDKKHIDMFEKTSLIKYHIMIINWSDL